MMVNMAEGEWDAVIRVHLRGTFAPSHFAAQHWRARSKAGEYVNARLINTTSPSGIFGNVGQANYCAAKAGIAGFTITTGAGTRTLRRDGQRGRPYRADPADRSARRREPGRGGQERHGARAHLPGC